MKKYYIHKKTNFFPILTEVRLTVHIKVFIYLKLHKNKKLEINFVNTTVQVENVHTSETSFLFILTIRVQL